MPETDVIQSSARLALQLGKSRPKQSRRGTSVANLKKLVDTFETSAEFEDWPQKTPAMLVALFCWAHEAIYEVSCVSEVASVFNGAVSAATKLVKDEFDGSLEHAAEYLRWVWARERSREAWRRKNTGFGRVLSWRHVFHQRELIKEMRLDAARTKGIP